MPALQAATAQARRTVAVEVLDQRRHVDLRPFDPAGWRRPPAGVHRIRRLVGGYRLAVPELEALGGGVVGILDGDRWVLRHRRRGDAAVALQPDERWRIAVPPGVRHCLGLGPWVGISVPADADFVLVWATALLDARLGVDQ